MASFKERMKARREEQASLGFGESRPKLSFCVQKHAATRLHYDFRLQIGDVLVSWAVPKGPSMNPLDKRLAVHVEDHSLKYGEWEGVIPRGSYGAGPVLLWDKGEFEPLGDPAKGLAAGKISFKLHGQRLKGQWALIRMGKNWLLCKKNDADAYGAGKDVVEMFKTSIKSGRTIEELNEQENPLPLFGDFS